MVIFHTLFCQYDFYSRQFKVSLVCYLPENLISEFWILVLGGDTDGFSIPLNWIEEEIRVPEYNLLAKKKSARRIWQNFQSSHNKFYEIKELSKIVVFLESFSKIWLFFMAYRDLPLHLHHNVSLMTYGLVDHLKAVFTHNDYICLVNNPFTVPSPLISV